MTLQATSSNLKELSCQEVEDVSPKVMGVASELQEGVDESNAAILSMEEIRATKTQKQLSEE